MSGRTSSILLIDDDKDVLLAARFILKRHFSEITTLNSPQDLDTLLSKHHFDVVLLDMNYTAGVTSGQEGFEVLGKIKASSPNTRVIMMTAYGDIDLAIKAIKEGALDFIVKPWDNTKLVNTIFAAMALDPVKMEIKDQLMVSTPPPAIPYAEVTRIFMFLDLISSTSIAEALGHARYFELLNDFFTDIAPAIEKNKGQIYQYVGDEVVVTWPIEDGLENGHCIQCFWDIVDQMELIKAKYERKYQLVPTFKAGMHFGKVSTGVVGTLKKEIIFTGDVLNTTSRIEGLCHVHKVNLLVSGDLIDQLQLSDGYNLVKLGSIGLRGRVKEVILYTIQRKSLS